MIRHNYICILVKSNLCNINDLLIDRDWIGMGATGLECIVVDGNGSDCIDYDEFLKILIQIIRRDCYKLVV